MEPYSSSGGVKTWGYWANPPTTFMHIRMHRDYLNPCLMQFATPYKKLLDQTPVKTKLISTVCSGQYIDPGHIFRINFIKKMADNGVNIDVYGRDHISVPGYKGGLQYGNKEDGLMPYKYYFHAENNSEYNYVSEKLWEPICAECVTFYWGCPNVSDYVNSACYIAMDDDLDKSLQIVINAIQSDEWSRRINTIRAEKKKILEVYSLYPLIDDTVRSFVDTPIYIMLLNGNPTITTSIINGIKNTNLYNRCRRLFVLDKSSNYTKLSEGKIRTIRNGDFPVNREQMLNAVKGAFVMFIDTSCEISKINQLMYSEFDSCINAVRTNFLLMTKCLCGIDCKRDIDKCAWWCNTSFM
jgi:hypothetical protein